MLIKWTLIGGVVGFVLGGFSIEGAVAGGILGYLFRRWILRMFWT